MFKKFDVVVLGSIAIDNIIYIDEMPSWDETKIVDIYEIELGGSAANVAYCLAKLGVKTVFHAKVGGDYWAKISLDSLKRAGVDVSRIIVDDKLKTVQAFILVDRLGRKIILVSTGKDFALSLNTKDIEYSLIDNCKVVYIGETFLEVVEAVASYAKKKGKYVVYRILAPYARMGYSAFKRLLSYVNLLILNSRSWEILKASGAQIEDMLRLGLKYVIVTLGEKGCTIYGKDKAITIPPFRKIKIVDTTGCGDAFTAGLIAKLLEKQTIIDAVKHGNMIAAWAASEIGARKGIAKFISKGYV